MRVRNIPIELGIHADSVTLAPSYTHTREHFRLHFKPSRPAEMSAGQPSYQTFHFQDSQRLQNT